MIHKRNHQGDRIRPRFGPKIVHGGTPWGKDKYIGGRDLVSPSEPALAAELTKLCTREVPLVEMNRALERLEEARKLKPTGAIMECTGLKNYKKPLEKGGFGADPEVVALETRWLAACPK